MEIERVESKDHPVYFDNILPGDCFLYVGNIYMRLTYSHDLPLHIKDVLRFYAVRVKNGVVLDFSLMAEVKPLETKVIYREK
jgi:hypothetical protein